MSANRGFNGCILIRNEIPRKINPNAQNIVSSLGDKILNSLNVITNETIELEEPKYNADAYEFFLKGKFKLTNSKNEESIEIARGLFLKAIDLDSTFIDPNMLIGETYFDQGDYEKSLKYYKVAEFKYKQMDDKFSLSELYMRMSNLFQRRGEVDVALEYGILSLKISEEFDNVFRLASSYQNIAGVYLRKSNYLKSSEFYNKALNNYNLLEDDKGISIVNHNSALMLMQYGDFKLAKTRFLKASQNSMSLVGSTVTQPLLTMLD